MLVELIAVANNNKIVWGLTMLLMNFGSRYIVGDLGKAHDAILSNQIVKKLIVFSLFFVATRDVLTAFLLTIVYIVVIDGILHEKSKFCIVPRKVIKTEGEEGGEQTNAAGIGSIEAYKRSLAALGV
jgi:hypothetical protein